MDGWLLTVLLLLLSGSCVTVRSHAGHHHHEHSHLHSNGVHDHQAHDHHHHGQDAAWVAGWKRAALYWLDSTDPHVTVTVAAAVITLTPLAMVALLMPRRGAFMPAWLMRVLTGFGAGALLGDVVVHSLPAIFASHTPLADDDDVSRLGDSLLLLAGMACFLVVDKLFRSAYGGHSHSHSHSHDPVDAEPLMAQSTALRAHVSSATQRKGKQDPQLASHQEHNHRGREHYHDVATKTHSAGYLNLLGSVSHTLSDGLTLGFAYFTSSHMALSVTLAVFLHEIPHKIGDYALLLHSGVPRGRALLLSLLGSTGTWLGVGLIVWLRAWTVGGDPTDTSQVFLWDRPLIPFTTGALLYTATVGLLAEMVEHGTLFQFTLQLLSMILGVGMMAAIAEFE